MAPEEPVKDRPGPDPSDQELDLLQYVNKRPEGFATARDVEPETQVGYKQTRNRLDDMVERGLLNVRKVGTVNVYWVSDKGADYLRENTG